MDNLIVPLMLIFIAFAIIVVLRIIVKRYVKIPPNTVGIFYGRKYPYKDPVTQKTKTRDFKVLTGGGQILLPHVESYQEMSIAVFQVEADYLNIPNQHNRKINLKSIMTCKISNSPEDLINAVQAFLGKTDKEIAAFVQNILESRLRSTIDNLGINTLESDRSPLTKQVTKEVSVELKRLGIQVIALVIKES